LKRVARSGSLPRRFYAAFSKLRLPFGLPRFAWKTIVTCYTHFPRFCFIVLIAALSCGCAASNSTQFEAVGSAGADQTTALAPSPGAARFDSALDTDPFQPRTARSPAAAGFGQSASRENGAVAALSTADGMDAGGYRVGALDVLEVSVFRAPELSSVFQVSEAGTINFPLVGDVFVAGRTGREIEINLTLLLKKKYLQKPQVTVFVKEYNNQKITLEGAVKRPGVFPLQGRLSLLQAVAMAQGLEESSDDTVVVFRSSDGRRQAARFDVSDIRTGSVEDPELMSGDVIVAGTSTIKKALGGVLKMMPALGMFTLL
jgi:polysaccharide biosynthesis/export protein